MVLVLSLRLFTGIALAPNVLNRLSALLDELRPTARLNWSPADNLHITTRFIGECSESKLEDVKEALSGVTAGRPIQIEISRFGFFPNPHRPHSFFAGVEAGPGLADLAASINQALRPLGYEPENRAYRPHVTLARIKPNADIRRLHNHIASLSDFDFGGFEAGSFHLYQSTPAARGSVYTTLATYDLMRENNTIS